MENGFEFEVLQRLSVIETKIDGFQNLDKRVSKLETLNTEQTKDLESLRESVSKIQDNNKWLARTVGATLITAVITVLITLL